MKKLSLSRISAALVVCGAMLFIACDSGYVEETRKPQDYIADWSRAVEQGFKAIIPKSYKGGKGNTQPPFIILISLEKQGAILVENKRFDEIQSFKVNDGKCEVGRTRNGSSDEEPSAAEIKCDAKSVSKIELDTSAGKFTYKF